MTSTTRLPLHPTIILDIFQSVTLIFLLHRYASFPLKSQLFSSTLSRRDQSTQPQYSSQKQANMSVVSLLGVKVLNNPANFSAPYEFEITFECLEQLQKGTRKTFPRPLLYTY